jgi:DNA-directed RNA polymerase subunit K/omega
MIHRPIGNNSFEFVWVASLRTAQLMRGCTARVVASPKPAVTAQREVAGGFVQAVPRVVPVIGS